MGVTTVLLSVFCLVLLAVPGFILGKTKMLPENAAKVLTTVLLFAGQPLLSFMSFQKTEYSADVVKNLGIVAGLAAAVHVIMIIILFGIFYRKAANDKKYRVVSFASMFGNCGFMGLPFLQMLFSNGSAEAIMYGAVVVAVFNFFSWTVGIFMITRDKKYISIKKAILNPPFIALIVSLPLFLILKKPINLIGNEGTFVRELFQKIYLSFNYLSDLVTPLSMIILGYRLSQMHVKDVFLCKHSYISMTFKLIVMPAITFLFCTLLGVEEVIKYALFFEFCMPTATQTLLFSEQFDGGEQYTASSAVLLSSIMSVATIPLMFLIFSSIFGCSIAL